MNTNTTDQTRGMPLAERILLRMAELEAALKIMDDKKTIEREALETALGAAQELTTGDLAHPSDVVAHEMNTWLERNKYLAETPDLSPPRGSDPAVKTDIDAKPTQGKPSDGKTMKTDGEDIVNDAPRAPVPVDPASPSSNDGNPDEHLH